MKGPGSPTEVLCFCEATVQDYMARSKFTLALEMLVQHYQAPILRYCHCHVLDPEVAQEVAQEVFLAALEGMPRFRGHGLAQDVVIQYCPQEMSGSRAEQRAPGRAGP